MSVPANCGSPAATLKAVVAIRLQGLIGGTHTAAREEGRSVRSPCSSAPQGLDANPFAHGADYGTQ